MAKKDPSKDAKFDTDMDSMLDRYDSGIGDFFEEDIEGADKDRGPVGRALHSISSNISKAGESIASGAAEGIHREISKSMPELGKTWDTAKEISNEAANIRDAVKEKVGPLWTETKRAMRTLGNKLSGQLPFGLDKKILALAGEEEQQERRLSVAEQRTQAISNNLNEIFKLQEQKSMEQQKDAVLNRLVDRRISAKHHQEEAGLLSTIANQSLFHTNFTKNIFTAYMKKDLELKYKSFYVAADSLDVLKAGIGSIEKRLDAVVKNTALPDADKIYLSERVKGTMKQQLADKLGHGVNSIISSIGKTIKDNILGDLNSASIMTSMLDTTLGFLPDANDGLAGFGDDSMSPKGMVRNAIGSFIGNLGGKKAISWLKSKLPKDALGYLTSILRGGGTEGLTTLIAEAKRGRFKNMPAWAKFLLRAVPGDMLSGSQLYNSTYNSIEAGGKITNRTIATIEEIIPGYLRMQTKFLEMMATGKTGEAGNEVQEQWYDFKTQSFMRANDLESRYDEEIKNRLQRTNELDLRRLYQGTSSAVSTILDDVGAGEHKDMFISMLSSKEHTKELHQFLYNLAYNPEYRLITEDTITDYLIPTYAIIKSGKPDLIKKLNNPKTKLGEYASVIFNNIPASKRSFVIAFWYSILTKPAANDPDNVVANTYAITNINQVLGSIYHDGLETVVADMANTATSMGHGQLIQKKLTSGRDARGNAIINTKMIATSKGTLTDEQLTNVTKELSEEEERRRKIGILIGDDEEYQRLLEDLEAQSGLKGMFNDIKDEIRNTKLGKKFFDSFDSFTKRATDTISETTSTIAHNASIKMIEAATKISPHFSSLLLLLRTDRNGNLLKKGKYRNLSELSDTDWLSWLAQVPNIVELAKDIQNYAETHTLARAATKFLPSFLRSFLELVSNEKSNTKIAEANREYIDNIASVKRKLSNKKHSENDERLALARINKEYIDKICDIQNGYTEEHRKASEDRFTSNFVDVNGATADDLKAFKTHENTDSTKFAKGGNVKRSRNSRSYLIDDIGGFVNQATSILGGAGIAGEAGGETIIPHKYNDRFKELIYKCVRDTVGEEAARKILRTLKPSKTLLKKLKINLSTNDVQKFASGGFFSKWSSWFSGKKASSEAKQDSEEVQTETEYKRMYGIDETNDILRNILIVNEAMYHRLSTGVLSMDISKYGDASTKLMKDGWFGSLGTFLSSAASIITSPIKAVAGFAGSAITNTAGFVRHLFTNKICDVYKAPPNKGDKPKPEDILIRVNDFKRGVYKDAKCKKQINTVADLTIPAFTRDEDGTIRPIVDANMAPFGVCDINGKPLVSTGGSIGRGLRKVFNIPLSIIQPLKLAKKFGDAVKSITRGLVDPYCDVYSLRAPQTRLVEGSDIKEGKIITIDPKNGKESVVKTVFDIKGVCYKLVIDPEHPDKLKKSGEPVIKPEDIEAKLCDVNQNVIESSYLTKFGTYLRRVGGGLLSTMGSVVGGVLEGATNVIGVSWKATKAIVSGAWKLGVKAFTAKNPYIDVYVVRDGKPKCVILGADLKNNKNTCRYIYKDNNEPVTSAYGIDREVISWFSEDGNTKLEQPRTVISDDDIRNGIFDSNGTKLTKFAGRSFAGKLASLGIGVAKFVGKKVLKLGMGVLRMGKNVINALGSVLGEGGAIVSGFLGNLWNQTVDLFKSSLISRQDLQEIVGQRLLDIYALLYTYMPRREGMDDKDGDGLLDNRYKEWKEGKEAARKAKEEKKSDKGDGKDDEKKPGFFSGLWSKLFGKKDGEGEQQAEGGGGDSIFKEAFDYWIMGKIFGNGGGAAGGGKVGMLKRIGGWFGKMFGGKAAAGAAQTAAGAAAKGGLKGLAKGAWSKLGGFVSKFGIKSIGSTVAKFGIKTLVKGAGIAGLALLAADLGMAAYKLSKDDARMLRMRPIRCKAYGIDPKYWEAVIDLETDTFEAIQNGQAEGVDKKRIRQFGYKIDFINEGELASGGNKADFLRFWYTKRFLPAYTEYCSAIKAVRDHVAMQEAAKNGQKEVDFDKSQPKETDIPNEMFTEALNAIKDNLSKYSTGEYENYTPDIEHYKKWIGEIAEKAKEHGMGESIKYDNKDLRSDIAGVGDASSHLSYAWNELKHGNILNAGIAFDKAIVTGVAKTLINFFTPDFYVSQNQEIWEEIRYKLYGFDKNKCPRDEASRFIEVFREMEIDQIHYVDKEQPAPSKEELADWAKELFPESDRAILRNRLIMQGANEKELSSDLSGEIIGFFASWWRRVFLPVFSIYATVVRVACGDKPGDSVHPDNLDEDNRANALREFESQANRFLGDNKFDSDILKMSPDGFVRYMLIRCEGDKTEYAKDLQGLTREEEKTFDQRLSKELNEAGDDFSRSWRRFKNFQIGAGLGALIKGTAKGLWGMAKATGESIGAGLSEMFNSSINGGNWMERFYDYGFPDVSGYTDWIEPTRVKVARAFETTVCESWLSGWQKPIVDGKFIQLLSSTELLDKVITAANIQPPSSSGNKTDLISNGLNGRVLTSQFAGGKGARKNWWMLLGAGWGTMTFGEFKKRLSNVFYPEEMKLINELVEYMKFWYEIRMKPVATTFFEVATGYGMDAQPTFTNLDVDDIPVEKRAEALEAYKAAKNKTLTQTNKVYNLTVTGFNTYQEDKKRLTQENTEGKPKSEATAAIEGIQKQQKEAEGKAVADIITHVMPKLGAEESKNLAKMLEDTSEIDQAVADSTKMTEEAAEAMLAKLGLQHFAGGKVATKTEQLSMAFCNAVMLNDMGALEGSQTTIGTLLNKAHAYFFGAVDSKATSDEEYIKMLEEFTAEAISGVHYENGKPVAGGGGIETTCHNLLTAQKYFGYTELTNAGITIIGEYSTYKRGFEIFNWNSLSFEEMAKYKTMYYQYVASWFAKVFIPIYIYYVIAMNKMTGDKIGTKPNAGALNRMQIAQMIKLMNNARNKVKLGKYATLTMKHGCPTTFDLITFFKQWLEQDKQGKEDAKEDNAAVTAERQAHYNDQAAAAAKKQEEEAKQQEYQKQQDDADAKWQEDLNRKIAEADAALVAAATGKQVDLSNEVGAINAGSGNTVNSALSSTAAKVNEQLQNQTDATKAASGVTNKLNDKLRNAKAGENSETRSTDISDRTDKSSTAAKKHITVTRQGGTTRSRGGDSDKSTTPKSMPNKEQIARKIWKYFTSKGWSDEGVAGLLGNIEKESYVQCVIVQGDLHDPKFKKSIAYTEAADSAETEAEMKKCFIRDSKGYGLCQWTYHTRKRGLLNYARSLGKSVGDPDVQIAFLFEELEGGKNAIRILTKKGMLKKVKNATSVKEATDIILLYFEAPAAVQTYLTSGGKIDGGHTKELNERAGYAQYWFNKFHNAKLDGADDVPSSIAHHSAEEQVKPTNADGATKPTNVPPPKPNKQDASSGTVNETTGLPEVKAKPGGLKQQLIRTTSQEIKDLAGVTEDDSGVTKDNAGGVIIPTTAAEAIKILKTLPHLVGAKTSLGGKDWVSVSRLNPEFLKRLAVAGQLYEKAKSPKDWSITSAFRTYSEQAELKRKYPSSAAKAGTSRHETGIAIDLGDKNFGGIKGRKYDRGTSVDMLEPYLKMVGIIRRYRPNRLDEAQHFELAQSGRLPDLAQFAAKAARQSIDQLAQSTRAKLAPTDKDAIEEAKEATALPGANDTGDTSVQEITAGDGVPDHIPHGYAGGFIPDHIPQGGNVDFDTAAPTTTGNSYIDNVINTSSSMTSKYFNTAIDKLKSSPEMAAPSPVVNNAYVSDINAGTMGSTSTNVKTNSFTQADIDKERTTTPVVAELRLITEVVKSIYTLMRDTITKENTEEEKPATTTTTPKAVSESFWDKVSPTDFAAMLTDAVKGLYPVSDVANGSKPRSTAPVHRAPMVYPLDTRKA